MDLSKVTELLGNNQQIKGMQRFQINSYDGFFPSGHTRCGK